MMLLRLWPRTALGWTPIVLIAGYVLFLLLRAVFRYINTSPKLLDQDDPEHTPLDDLYGQDRDRK